MSTDPLRERFAAFGMIDPPPPIVVSPSIIRVPTSSEDATRERGYALGALRSAAAEMAATPTGRNVELNRHVFKMTGYVATGALTEDEVVDALTDAARAASGLGDHPLTETEIRTTLRSALAGGRAKGLVRSAPLAAEKPRTNGTNGHANGHATNGLTVVDSHGHTVPLEPTGRVIAWQTGDQIATAAPVWAWHYHGKGRIQLGTLALLAGRPGAGKSTAARWFAAHATRGTLDGCWEGRPQHVAYIASEESMRYTVAPGLIAAGADMTRVHFPSVTRDGEATALLSTLDEIELTRYCRAHHITLVIVDPVMSTMTAQVDINKNNEIRAQIAPWGRLADHITGLVLGVAHLRKSNTGDVVAAITGSSAFGEVARAVFGFAKNPADNDVRVMSQHKNSTGYEDLSVTYEIASVAVELADGKTAEVGAFTITGTSEVSVEDILAEGALQSGAGSALLECQRWLSDYLSVEGPLPSKAVKAEGRKAGDWSPSTVERAARKLHVVVESRGFPRHTYWLMPIASQWPPHKGAT